jgi:chromosome segregation ATPase
MITPDVSVGHLLTIGVTLTLAGLSAFASYVMLRAQAKQTAERLSEHTSTVKESVDGLGKRVGGVEHDVHALRLEIAKEYVNTDKLREHKDRMSKRMDSIDHQIRQVPQQIVDLLNIAPAGSRRARSGS